MGERHYNPDCNVQRVGQRVPTGQTRASDQAQQSGASAEELVAELPRARATGPKRSGCSGPGERVWRRCLIDLINLMSDKI
jgi:hypothetical protein